MTIDLSLQLPGEMLYVVVTNGAQRLAEVAARFTLERSSRSQKRRGF